MKKVNVQEKKIEIIEPPEAFELIEEKDYIRINADGSKSTGMECMLTENTVSIRINGEEAGNVPCIPQHMTELVIGWLNAEGYIDSMEELKRMEILDIRSKEILPDDVKAEVINADIMLADRFADPRRVARRLIKPVVPIRWEKEWIFSLAEDFENMLPLRQRTMAAHNCRLARAGEILFRCEDIGRHSAIDKVIGWAMRNSVDMRDCILFTSGRISRAMVQKVVRAGIPVMAGKGTTSKKAVQLAREKDLTLIGHSRKDSLSIFTQP